MYTLPPPNKLALRVWLLLGLLISGVAGAAPVIDTGFDTCPDPDFGFVQNPWSFRTTGNTTYENGACDTNGGFDSAGGLNVVTGGIDSNAVFDMQAGWQASFNLAQPEKVTLSFRYNLTLSSEHEADEFGQVIAAIDGVGVPGAGADYIVQITGDGNGGSDDTTGWVQFNANLGTLSAGPHSVTIGAYHNQKNVLDEVLTLEIDDVLVDADPCGNGILDGVESCDDGAGNGTTSCGCALDCTYPLVGASCEDGDLCSVADTCDGAGACVAGAPLACDDGLLCNGTETCDPGTGCLPGTQPGLGALFRGDIVVADPRAADPLQDPIILAVDPVSGVQTPLSIGGFMTDPRDVEVEANRCVVVADDPNKLVMRIDPLLYDPLDPSANQVVLTQDGNLQDPRGIAVAPNGDIFVADRTFQGTIHRIDPFTGAQSIAGQGGHLQSSRRVAIDAAGRAYVPVYEGPSAPSVIRIDPDTYDPLDAFANQEIVASGGDLFPSGGPWDLDFDPLGRLILVNAQDWNVFRIDVDAYDPLDLFANQERVADGGGFIEIRGSAFEDGGTAIITNEGGIPSVIRVDVDAFDPLDQASNQTTLASSGLMVEPRGADVVEIGLCGNGLLDPGETCDDGNEIDGDCCSAVCQLDSSGSVCVVDACQVGGTCDGAGACTGTTPVVCDDAQFCNGAESCDPLLGCQAGAPPPVDDGVTCTVDTCDEILDVVINLPSNPICDNGAFCDGSETCDPVLDCQAGTPPVVDDGVTCTVDTCDEVLDVVINNPSNPICDNAAFCDGAETCDPVLDCQAGLPPVVDDGITCTLDSCDEVGDVVVNLPTDAICDNGAFCDGAEICDPALDCQAGPPPTADDGVVCTDEVCDEVGDVVSNVPNDANCTDGLLCNGAETCDPTLDCQPGTLPGLGMLFRGDIVVADPRAADPLQDPILLAVDPVTGAQTPLSIGGFMTDPRDVEVEANRCLVVADDPNKMVVRVDPLLYDPLDPSANQVVLSQDGNLQDPRGIAVAPNGDIFVADRSPQGTIHRIDPFTGAQSIAGQGGHLQFSRRVAVDAAGLVYVPVYEGPSAPAVVRIDPNAYDPLDAFANQEIVASDGDLFPSGGPWDLDFDPLGQLFLINAQDWNVFRIDVDAYDPLDPFANQERVADSGGFVEIRGVALEESGDVIVSNEGGIPTLIRVDPDAFDPPNWTANQTELTSNDLLVEPRGADVVGLGRCGNGVVNPGETCDDGNELDGDCCSSVCQLDSSGSVCVVDACQVGGTCDGAGACTGTTPVVCDDTQFCNGAESCDPLLGCQTGLPPVTDDGITCTVDSCDEVGDVVVNLPTDAICDNAAFCDGAETCDPVLDCQAGLPPVIDDGITCTVDSCDEVGDVVVNLPTDAICDNAAFCDGAETCDPVLDCQAGLPPVVDDGITCTVDSCDEVGDVVVNLPTDAICDNGAFCDGAETCDPALDCQAGPPPTADDGVVCTDEICDEVGDVVSNVPNDANCTDGLLCNGAETCDPTLDCQPGTLPGLGMLFRGDIVVADPRAADPLQDPILLAVDPITGSQIPLSIGGFMTDPRDVEVEANRCLVVADDPNKMVLRIDPLLYDPLDPSANQVVLTQDGNLQDPRGIAVAPSGDIFVADRSFQGTIHRIDPFTGAQSIAAEGGHLQRSRRVAVDPAGLVYVPVYEGPSAPAVIRVDPDAYDPLDAFANQEIVASGGDFFPSGPWDLDFDPLGQLFVVNAQDWNLFRIDVDAYDPLDPFANQEIVADGGGFLEIRGIAVEESGLPVVTNEGGIPTAIRVDPDAFDPPNWTANQTTLTSNDLFVEPRGADVVGIGQCGNGVLDPGEACDDGNELDGDCCSAVCQLDSSGSVCVVDACQTGGTCDGAGACTGAIPVVCDNSLFCDGTETCDPMLGCQAGVPPLTDDGIVCTVDSCDEVGDVVVNLPTDAICDNAAFCDGTETCDPVLDCQAGLPPVIDDGITCTLDTCDEMLDVVINNPSDPICDNGAFCDGAETCDPVLDCQAGLPPVVDDGITCTVDSCDEVGDVVVNLPTDAICDNAAFCDGSETCDPALDCQAGLPPTADDGVVCTDEICDEVGDVVSSVPNDANCTDGLLCNGAETCDPTLDCQPGTQPGLGALFLGDIVVADPRAADPLQDPILLVVDPVTGAQTPLSIGGLMSDPRDVEVEANRCLVVADDSNRMVLRIDPLLYDPLDPSANQVVLTQDGNLQDPRGIAVAPSGDIFVADRSFQGTIHRIDPFTGAQSIAAEGGHLQRSRRVAVDPAGLVYVPVYEGPSAPAVIRVDPDAYDPLDVFANQEIVASGGDFFPSGPWDLDFDPLGQLFVVNAQDWNLFRIDVDAYDPLDPFANQEIVADGGGFLEIRGIAVEESGMPIVTNEGGIPTAIRVDPDAFDPPNWTANQTTLTSNDLFVEPRGADVVGIGQCGDGFLDPGETCDDGNELDGDCCSAVCQLDSLGSVCVVDACVTSGTCDGAGACTGAIPVVCDNSLFCDGAETCDLVLGCQAGVPPVTDDGIVCTVDSCDEVGDVVVNLPTDAICDNAAFCDGAETCDPALDCQAGVPPVIDDGIVCTVDSCDEIGDVVVNTPSDPICDNAAFCDGAETCDPVLDCQAGTPPVVDDGIVCTVDSCDEVGDVVVNTPSDPICDNAAFCDGAETCDPALDCQAGTPPVIDDGIVCTIDSCDEIGDVVVNTPSDPICDNAAFCDGSETCDPALDCQAGTPPVVDDGIVCTVDSCDEVGDVVVNAPNDALCDNGEFCDGTEICDPALDCQAGTPPVVDDGVPCTNDSCDEVADVVVNDPLDGSCDATGPCTAPLCDPILGCTSVPVPDCEPQVPALPGWGRVLLMALLALGGLSLRKSRRSS